MLQDDFFCRFVGLFLQDSIAYVHWIKYKCNKKIIFLLLNFQISEIVHDRAIFFIFAQRVYVVNWHILLKIVCTLILTYVVHYSVNYRRYNLTASLGHDP